MQVEGRDRVYVVKKAAVDVFRHDVSAFREDRFAQFDPTDAVALEASVGRRELAFERAGERAWRMRAPVEQDAARDKVELMIGRVAAMRALAFVADLDTLEPPVLKPWGLGDRAPRIVVRLAGAQTVSVRLGHAVPDVDPAQRYVLHEEGRAVYAVHEGMLEAYEESNDAYRKRAVFDRREWNVVEMTLTDAEQGEVRLGRTADGWRWPDGAQVSGVTPKRVATHIAELSAVVFHDRARSDFGFDSPTSMIAVSFDDGSSHQVALGRRHRLRAQDGSGEAQYVRIDGQKTVISVGLDLGDVIADLWREYGRKRQRDGAKRLDEPDPGN